MIKDLVIFTDPRRAVWGMYSDWFQILILLLLSSVAVPASEKSMLPPTVTHRLERVLCVGSRGSVLSADRCWCSVAVTL